MSVAVREEPRLLHALPGRIRVHLPQWRGDGQRGIERRLRALPGVRSVQATPLTGNVLIRFDPVAMNVQAVLMALHTLEPGLHDARESAELAHDLPSAMARVQAPLVLRDRRGPIQRARLTVRGLDRDPHLSRRVVDRLERHPGVRARANPLTGRVLVEITNAEVALDDLLADVADLEVPALPGEDRPGHPLDPTPLLQSATRTVGTALGLGLLAARQLAGLQASPVAPEGPATVAGIIGLLQGFPLTRNGLRVLLGRHVADLLFSGAAIVSLTLAGSPLGLAVTGAEALRLLTEVVARRAAWRRYEERLEGAASTEPGAVIRLDAGERIPRAASVIEGTGSAVMRDGLPVPVMPGTRVPAGARLWGGPCVVELDGDHAFVPQPRPAPVAPSLYDRYQQVLGLGALAYAALTAVITRSPARTFAALLLVNPRTAIIGAEAASTGAAARVLRAGVTVVGTRPDRSVRRPDILLLDGARVLTDGVELASVLPLREGAEAADALALAAGIAIAAGSPWGGGFPVADHAHATNGTFDGFTATAHVGDVPYTLGLAHDNVVPAEIRLRHRGARLLVLQRAREEQPLALFVLRPRLAAGVADLVQACRRHGVEMGLLAGASPMGDAMAAQEVARRAQVPLLSETDPLEAIRARQLQGAVVAFVSDSADAAPVFAACDLAIGLSSGRSGQFPARADLLAPDLGALTAIVEAGARRDAATRDAVALSAVANVAGAVWGFRGQPGVERASLAVYATALCALADGWARLRGGQQPRWLAAQLVDPRPERWGRRSVPDVLRILDTTAEGLTTAQAAERQRAVPAVAQRHALLTAILDQIRSPVTGTLAAAAGFSLVLGSALDVAIIGATIAVNVAVGAWQEHQAGQAAEALQRLSMPTARVLRDGRPETVPATELVPGDVLLLMSGDRVAADARLLGVQGLEVDEAALTGESLPVPKAATGGTDMSRVVLEGSDVTIGTGLAVVVAVGRRTRLGATAAALAVEETQQSPLGTRLYRLMGQIMPLSAAGGALVTVSGLLRGQPLLAQLAIGASLAIAALPEGLPLLAGTAQAAVARRLMRHQALMHRLSAVEALGRVDVACADKTGTLTEGRLALRVVADLDDEVTLPILLPADLRHVLLTAAFASPHPDAVDVAAHPTDLAVAEAARGAGLIEELRAERTAESPFEPTQSFHTAVVHGRLCVKGAPEVLLSRCTYVRMGGHEQPLDETHRQALRARAQDLAARGLRVLMVADGPAEASVDDPQELTALGFVGIRDALRPGVPAAVRRCHDAGIRVIMLTGDHPTTARAIAREAGLLADDAAVLRATEIAELEESELDERLEGATVIARATPLDKLRIVESLQRRGHTVAMTGDGVNDAPALRLADVGVAMGRGGTEVARQAADVVLADDDFATLVEALVEGRSFWRNIRRALGLLLGGNLGELGLVVPASVLTLTSPLTTPQILAVNLITDALPALAVALQPPEHRNLAALAREGTAALDAPLHRDVVRRATSTAAPSLAAYLIALGGGLPSARSVAFASIVATQLAQTLDVGWAEGSLTRPVLGAVGGSAGVLVAALTVPPVRDVLSLVTPTPLGWTLIGTGAAAAVLLNRVLTAVHSMRRLFPPLAPPHARGVLAPPAEPLLLPAPKG